MAISMVSAAALTIFLGICAPDLLSYHRSGVPFQLRHRLQYRAFLCCASVDLFSEQRENKICGKGRADLLWTRVCTVYN